MKKNLIQILIMILILSTTTGCCLLFRQPVRERPDVELNNNQLCISIPKGKYSQNRLFNIRFISISEKIKDGPTYDRTRYYSGMTDTGVKMQYQVHPGECLNLDYQFKTDVRYYVFIKAKQQNSEGWNIVKRLDKRLILKKQDDGSLQLLEY
ncbi:putative T6SS immunity periplasmic lipoprotein [Gilliamella sp. Pas-s25]|uniref:putative T6SS immunity periplasmic lipoprotein n=1 Tax=Gilliamella sp. Pas-s25 TaxID=2687310 RepID=UPI00135EC75B|nr:putative T6SS immunity periplasmic lipoprotein [Gilliamella sp. Pas-s25]MWP62162.1 hypothetical protein [Gilliamella sp. Pas-s25]